ncbi:MAG: hypothetical protein JNJ54_22420 [Myxococcaceae bacterium]|nr:hypothetical protein [Myxococcaceae bacterium]
MERRLHATQPQPRFWRISRAGSELVIRSGAAGTPGTVNRIPCKSEEAAQKTFDGLVAQRLKDGFMDEAQAPSTLSVEAERELLKDDPERWLVFADSLLETGDPVRGELIGLQVKAAKRARGSIGQAKAFVKEHYDALIGAELAGFHTQVTVEWRFGYARTLRIWSGPYTAPIGEVLEAALNSPASRFLERLEFGSPGTEGRYDVALKRLASLEWPAHLATLALGEFDVAEAFKNESAWPRIDSLLALQPVGSRLTTLEVRAALNTLGRGLALPNLERLVLKPWRLDARLLTDLQSFEVPKLKTLSFTQEGVVGVTLAAWASAIRRFLSHPGITRLELRRMREGAALLVLLDDLAGKLERVELIGTPASEAHHLGPLRGTLKNVVFECPESGALARALQQLGLTAEGPSEEVVERKKKAKAARAERAARRADEDDERYDGVVE